LPVLLSLPHAATAFSTGCSLSGKDGRGCKAVNAPCLRDENQDGTEEKGEAGDGANTREWAVNEVEGEDRHGQ